MIGDQRARSRCRWPTTRSAAGRTRCSATRTSTAPRASRFYTRAKVVTSRWPARRARRRRQLPLPDRDLTATRRTPTRRTPTRRTPRRTAPDPCEPEDNFNAEETARRPARRAPRHAGGVFGQPRTTRRTRRRTRAAAPEATATRSPSSLTAGPGDAFWDVVKRRRRGGRQGRASRSATRATATRRSSPSSSTRR